MKVEEGWGKAEGEVGGEVEDEKGVREVVDGNRSELK